ncbi:unnamed protein product [Ostreobium quekettii]|uniref:Uncharacterized protein n=1 Tax=Ostreobium quekettii TaxID=121088 RepID=A0A8S1J9H7_9CHLO|nr:unnamed protein product [Ostreobium quekettii]
MDTRKRKAEGAAEESTAKRGRIDAAKGTVILSEGPPRPSYKRPRARGGSNRRPPSRDSALERLNAAVVDGALWHAGCGEPLGGSGESIGVSFSSAEEYVAAFEPLLHEEARESLRAAWADNCDRGHHWEVALGGVGQAEGGWIGLEVRIRRKLFGKGPPRPAPGSAVVLSTFTPPKRGPMDAVHRLGVVAGIVGPPTRDEADRVLVQLHPACASHGGEEGAACRAVVGMLRAPRGPWCMTSGGSLITEQRECEALHSLNKIRFLGAILRPEAELVARLDDLPRKWPDEMGQGLHEFITSNYDRAQADAIAMCTAHFATPPEGPPEGEGGRHGRPLPIALIQGPPGTGKTHTVIGILNMWHLVQFQRFYERVVEQYKRDAGDAATAGGDWDNLMGLMKTGEVRRSMRPRILVCAPSNAAIDELLERILKAGFSDSEGGRYCPNAVRVGSEDAPISEAVKAVWSETLVSGYLKMEEAEWDRRYRSFSVRRKSLRDDIAGMEMRLQQSPGQLFAQASGLISALEKKEKLDLELERLEAVQSIVRGMQRPNKEVREELELSYLNSAEMVFTTLSSTSKKIFSKAKRGFETVLIDEAAQANEVAALQPLIHGCSQQFPSAYFYNNRLEDGPDVKNDRFAEFYAHGLLKPYVLFDVETGQHERQTTGSLHNRVEAELAASLFQELRSWLIKRCEELIRQGRPPPPGVTVAVITPYRSQRKCLRDVFIEILGVEVASEVKTMTIDSCQGKQVDVVILSCVRASTRSSGVGFVSDIRRMNVAITRAKRALWILGNCKTLRGSSTWGALIQDAESRGCLIKSASAKELFPHQPQFQPGFVRHTVPQPNQEADEASTAMQMEAVQTTNAPQSLPESQFFPAVAHEDGGIVNQFYEVAVPANVLDSVANLAEAATLPQGFAGSSDAQEPAVPRLGLTEVVQPFFAQAMTTGGDQHVLEHNPNVQAVQQISIGPKRSKAR